MDYRIILISSNQENREQIMEILSNSGNNFQIMPIHEMSDEIMQNEGNQPDLVLLDINADDQDSHRVLQFFHEKETGKRIPVIVLTSFQSQQFVDELCNAGAFDFINKPIAVNEFSSRLKKAIEVVDSYRNIDKKIQHVKEDIQTIEKLMVTSAHTSFAYMLINPSGEIEWVNDGFELLHGFNLEEFRAAHGKTIFGLAPGSEIGNLFYRCLKEKKSTECISKVNLRNGDYRWLQIFITPRMSAAGIIEKLVAVEVDISPFKIKEEELNAQYKRMKEITRHLEKANAQLEVQKGEINQQKMIIEEEQEKSEKLLLNILPFEVAKQLKSKGKAGTRQYKLVTVLFTDFKGFSNISKTLDPKDLVSILDSYFAKFDEITGAHYIEKIKTIGDAYMCAGGLPLSNKSNPIDAVLAGLEIQNYMNTLNDSKVLNHLPVWELRLGIHSGPVVAGVVGKKRFAYDIWGDTVNIASRMEQSGHVGWVNISGTTYEYVKDFFDCDYRGKIETKNLGKIDMYFVNRIKPEFSSDRFGILPNDLMINKVNKL
jgi:class 3 adenylate cyclase/DNA-binding response OmpR family regulator